MPILPRLTFIVRAATVLLLAQLSMVAHADIFQWEYVNPANPSQGKQQSSLLCPDGAGVNAVPQANLSNRNLTMAYLIGANLTGANLNTTNLTNADLSQATLNSILDRTTLTNANLSGANINGARFVTVTGFSAAQLYSTATYQSGDLKRFFVFGGNLTGWNFSGKNLTESLFRQSTLTSANFSGANLTKAYLGEDSTFSNANFSHANLTDATFYESTLANADFTDAEVRGADFWGTVSRGFNELQLRSTTSYKTGDLTGIKLRFNNLTGWSFAGKNLTNADFNSAILTNADFTGAEVKGALFFDNTSRGFTAAQLYSTASYQNGDLTAMKLGGNNLSGWNFAGKNLRNVQFEYSTLTSANFTDADVRGAGFWRSDVWGGGISAAQIYSTASYQSGDLSGIRLDGQNLSSWNLARKNLTNAFFANATLTNADFTGAEVRGATFWSNTSGGLTAAQLYSTASYQAGDLTGINLGFTDEKVHSDLTGWNFAGKNLTKANFSNATLTDADFTGADVRGAIFGSATATGLTPAQLYSTASYLAGDLTGVSFGWVAYPNIQTDLRGWNFSGRNLTNSLFYYATLNDANLSQAIFHNTNFNGSTFANTDLRAADTRGAFIFDFSGSQNGNMIWPDGHIRGLELTDARSLVVRHYAGDSQRHSGIIPIVVEQRMTMDSTSHLRLLFEADPWDSTISFVPGTPVMLGGTLELDFATDVDVAGQGGRAIRIFDWTGVTPVGTFDVVSPYSWDLSKLYTTGEVKLMRPGDFNSNGFVDAADYVAWRHSGGAQDEYNTWRSHFGQPPERAPAAATIGPGTADLHDSGDPGGARTNVDNLSPVTLRAGTYIATQFHFDSSGPGTAIPFLAVNSDANIPNPEFDINSYKIIAVGSLNSISPGQDQTVDFGGSDTFTLSATTKVFAGFYSEDFASKGTITINYSKAGTDHANSATAFVPVLGATTPTFTNPNLWWTYDFAIDVSPFSLAGDYNASGKVDAADYVVWRNAFGQSGAGLAADGNGDGIVNQADYDLWRAHFGQTTASSSAAVNEPHAAVPEPGTLALALLTLTLLSCGLSRCDK